MKMRWLPRIASTIGLCLGLISAIVALAANPQEQRRPDVSTKQTVAEKIEAMMTANYGPLAPGAAVLIAKRGQILLSKGYGLANMEHGIKVTPTTVFRIASLTKILTAAAVLVQVDQGRIGLEDPISKYVSGIPWKSGVPSVRHLLGHTSGLHDYLDRPDNMQWVRKEYKVQELIDSFKDRAPDFPPGERNVYSNSGYILLGAILEKVTGQPYADAVRDLILRPLGMDNTFYDEELSIIPGRAAGYEPLRNKDDSLDWSKFRNVRYYTLSCLQASGGHLSTVEDLHRFYRGLADGKLISRDLLKRSLEPVRLNNGRTAGTSLAGWQIDKIDGRTAFMKGGALPGVCTWFLFIPDEDFCLILLSNRSAGNPRCGMLALDLAKLALASE